MAKTSERGRSAITGQFVTKDYAANHPNTTVVEKVVLSSTETNLNGILPPNGDP